MFEQLGFFRDYFVDGKFVGSVKLNDYEGQIGYYSKKTLVVENEIVLDNKRKIKKGTTTYHFTYPLNGKLK